MNLSVPFRDLPKHVRATNERLHTTNPLLEKKFVICKLASQNLSPETFDLNLKKILCKVTIGVTNLNPKLGTTVNIVKNQTLRNSFVFANKEEKEKENEVLILD